MPILTIEAVRENPWNVVTHTLPAHPTELLLEVAYLAADYCRKGEYLLMNATRDGRYIPPGWQPTADNPDVHEENEGRGDAADVKLREIRTVCEREYGEILEL